MRRVYYLMRKEFRQIFRDRPMVMILFVVPLIQIFILGYAVTTDVVRIPVIMHDADRTPMSRDFVARFTSGEYFEVLNHEDDYRALTGYLDRGEASMAVVIPDGFQRAVVRGERSHIQVIVDGVDGNTAGVALGYLSEIAQLYQMDLTWQEPAMQRAARSMHLVKTEPRFWYNPALESRKYITPGIVALILTIITVFLTSMGIVREKEIGTLEQLMVTPIKSMQLIAGKILPFSILAFIEAAIAMLFVYLIFGIGIVGSIPLLFAEAALFILTTLGLGIFISTVVETQQQALFLGWFFMIFSILLSGFFIPIENMPWAIQLVTYLNPLRYFLVILREIYMKGAPLAALLPETLAMVLFGLIIFTSAVLRFRVRLKHGV